MTVRDLKNKSWTASMIKVSSAGQLFENVSVEICCVSPFSLFWAFYIQKAFCSWHVIPHPLMSFFFKTKLYSCCEISVSYGLNSVAVLGSISFFQIWACHYSIFVEAWSQILLGSWANTTPSVIRVYVTPVAVGHDHFFY